MTPRLMHRIAWALQHGRPTLDERAALQAAAQDMPAGASTLPAAGTRLLQALEQRAATTT